MSVRASSVRLGYTDAGRLIIELLDGAATFAFAELEAEQLSRIIGQGCWRW